MPKARVVEQAGLEPAASVLYVVLFLLSYRRNPIKQFNYQRYCQT